MSASWPIKEFFCVWGRKFCMENPGKYCPMSQLAPSPLNVDIIATFSLLTLTMVFSSFWRVLEHSQRVLEHSYSGLTIVTPKIEIFQHPNCFVLQICGITWSSHSIKPFTFQSCIMSVDISIVSSQHHLTMGWITIKMKWKSKVQIKYLDN